MSAPTSAIAAADWAFMAAPGRVPAEWTWTVPAAWWRMRAAAIWDLPPFFTHTNRTVGGFVLILGFSFDGVSGWGRWRHRGTGAAPSPRRRRPGPPGRGPRSGDRR